ncbi:MAG: hypothetical protein CVU38_11110 [Chloroflexi bacterium HGW-Chloroflexi-1]|nr:MAG: hypothetical protein CVU38_11110 [Chloroflexi bacterium HGW-Chloroflexi-1]
MPAGIRSSSARGRNEDANTLPRPSDKAQQRAAGLTSISPTLDLGNNLTLAAHNAEIAATRARLDAYNAALSTGDATYNTLREAEGCPTSSA